MSYKYDGEISEITVTQTALGKWLKLSQQRISQMAANGELSRDEQDRTGRLFLAQSLRDYYLSTKTYGDDVNYWHEKAKREKVNRKRDEIKLKKEEGAVYEAKTVELAFIEILTVLRTQLLGLPSKLAVQLEGKNRNEIYETMTQEIESRLKEMSEYEPKTLSKEITNEMEN